MKKHFISNLALLILLNLLIKPFWFLGIEVGVQNAVGESSYGFYFSLFSFSFVLNMLLDVGINNYNNRNISQHPERLREQLAAIIPLKFLLGLVYALFVLIGGKVLGYDQEQFRMLWVLVLNQFLASFILYFRGNISGLQFYRTDSLLSVMDRSLMILFTGMLLWGNIKDEPFRIEWFIYAQTLSYSLTLLTSALIVASKAGWRSATPRPRLSLKVLRAAYPFALLILMMALFNRVDSVMIERMLPDGQEEAGIYAQSFRFLDAANQFSFLFAGLLLPMFSRMLKQKEKVDDLVAIALPLLLFLGISVPLACRSYSFEIISLFYDAHLDYSSRIFGLLMFSFLFVSLSYLFGTLLTANHNLKQLNILAAMTVVLNIGLNLWLIPRYQAYGAAVASLASQGFYALSQWVLAVKLIRIPAYGKLLLRSLGFLILAVGTSLLSRQIDSWITGFLLLCISLALIAVVLGMLRPRDFLKILSERE